MSEGLLYPIMKTAAHVKLSRKFCDARSDISHQPHARTISPVVVCLHFSYECWQSFNKLCVRHFREACHRMISHAACTSAPPCCRYLSNITPSITANALMT